MRCKQYWQIASLWVLLISQALNCLSDLSSVELGMAVLHCLEQKLVCDCPTCHDGHRDDE